LHRKHAEFAGEGRVQAEQREEGSPQAAPTIADALTPASLVAVNMEVASGKLPTEVTDDIEAAIDEGLR